MARFVPKSPRRAVDEPFDHLSARARAACCRAGLASSCLAFLVPCLARPASGQDLVEPAGTLAPVAPATDAFARWSIGGWLGSALQRSYQGGADAEGAALLFRPDLELELGSHTRLHATLAIGDGDGVNDRTPYLNPPWAADLASTTFDINGSDRDGLLTAWIRQRFVLAGERELALTAGLVDATDYLDTNAFSNDELRQFMNAALVNGPNGLAPSYDLGGALEWSTGDWSADLVFLHVEDNSIGRGYEFVGAQLALHRELDVGDGTYRLYVGSTSDDFPAASGTGLESRLSVILSADQWISEHLGLWTRSGLREDDAVTQARTLYSGGLHVNGGLWGRERDELGVGLAWLDGDTSSLEDSFVTEVYLRHELWSSFSITLDAQYVRDRQDVVSDAEGVVLGVRAGYSF